MEKVRLITLGGCADNNRVYPDNEQNRKVLEAFNDKVKSGVKVHMEYGYPDTSRLWGDHPALRMGFVNPGRVCASIVDTDLVDNTLFASVIPHGPMREHIEGDLSKAQFGIRAFSSVNRINGSVVEIALKNIICWDYLGNGKPLPIKSNSIRDSENTSVVVLDEVDRASGNYHYSVVKGINGEDLLEVRFQKGPPDIVGINGVTMEDLLAICSHRLAGFQSGKFNCTDNQIALDHINAAIKALDTRTRDRQYRGVSGQPKV